MAAQMPDNVGYRISDDYEAILRSFGAGQLSLTYIHEVLVNMRVSDERSRSLGRIIRKSHEDYRALRSTGVGGIRALTGKSPSQLPQSLMK